MTDTTAVPTAIDAGELTLLVGDRPDTRAYLTNPVDLSDRDEARRTLAALRDHIATVLVGIEFDDPKEHDNRVVLAGADLAAVEFTTAAGNTIPTDEVLDRLADLDHITVTESE
ncbi:hypothetical protein GII32_10735 [Gordonia amarae]|uniref:hypothetical protein n=1 Tax=Gordonia amarae TaxID=36821 RepID=UPI001AF3AA54|nr:hypothetical protein [Gordonia amarae]QHN30793.1 hypothetical protein GII32_10735 [Gordonia amarae]